MNPPQWRRMMFILWIALACMGKLAYPQTAQITGSVTDSSGAVVPGAAVDVTNAGTGIRQNTTSNQEGYYTVPLLQPGTYKIAVQKSGFKTHTRAGLVLETGTTRTIDIQLEVGETTETVSVTAEAPLLESETSAMGQLIERANVINMPVESRRAASLVRLVGAVVYTGEEAGGQQVPIFSMAGGRSRSQMWQLDGTSVQNSGIGVAQLGLNPPSESLQEFKVEINNLSAEYGRTGGGFISMTTRSGANKYRGAVYEFVRNDAFDARTFFADRKPPLRYNIFGASIGGPIRRDKTFFFFNWEGVRRRDGLTFSTDEVPHPPEITGDFSNRRGLVLRDPVSGAPFPGNRIPVSRIDPVAQALARLYPAPNRPGNDITLPPRDNYLANVSDSLTGNTYTLRIDHTFSVNDRVFGRYMASPNDQVRQPRFPNGFSDPRANRIRNDHDILTVGWVHTFSPSLINDLRYNWGNRFGYSRSFGQQSNKNAEFGIKGADPSSFATIQPTGLTQLGVPNHERRTSPILTNELINHLTWIKGSHQLKFGGSFRYSKFEDENNAFAGGQFTFSDRATGDGFATFLLGWTTSAQVLDNDPIFPRSDYWSAFIQDDWKITPRFTINLGLRWDMDTPRWEFKNQQNGFDLNAINPVSHTPGVVTFAGRDGASKYAHDFDSNNVAPRFGFAWRPSDGLVVRGGYGIFYYPPYINQVTTTLTAGFSKQASFSSPDGGFTPPFLLRDGIPAPPPGEQLNASFGAVPVGSVPRLAPEFLQNNHLNAMSQQWNLTVQKQLALNSLLEVAYLGNVGHHLSGQPVNWNMIPIVNGRGPAAQDQRLRPYPQFNDLTLLYPPWGNSTYHALNSRFEKRFSQGLNFLANYTWSKFIDDVESQNEVAGGEGNGYTHLELRRLDKSLSGNDIRHRFIGSAVYELPLGKGRPISINNSVLNAIAGNWGVGAIVEFRSGAPYGVVEQTNRTNTFSHSQRPNLTGDPELSGDRSREEYLARWFDTAVFTAPGAGIFGNAPRTLCCGPGFVGNDFSAHKWFNFNERYRLQFRTDIFNLVNRANFALPNSQRGRGDFGRISSILLGSTGRQFQFGLRLEF